MVDRGYALYIRRVGGEKLDEAGEERYPERRGARRTHARLAF